MKPDLYVEIPVKVKLRPNRYIFTTLVWNRRSIGCFHGFNNYFKLNKKDIRRFICISTNKPNHNEAYVMEWDGMYINIYDGRTGNYITFRLSTISLDKALKYFKIHRVTRYYVWMEEEI